MSATTRIQSNAFNFQSYVRHGVDPRTGQYTVSLSLPELKSNALGGPVLPLTLSFSPMNTRDAGYGLGWSLNLTEYGTQSRVLSLGTGETFKVEGSGNQPSIREKKLDSFHFHDDGGGIYRVVHRSGLVEVLKAGGSSDNPMALPDKVLGPEGRAISLTYAFFAGDRRLASISDDSGELLRVVRAELSDKVELQFFPGKGDNNAPLATMVLRLDGYARVTHVMLPTDEQACWRFEYVESHGIFCLSDIWTPTGAHETVEYDGEGHRFPGGQLTPLPRVEKHIVDPGQSQPSMRVEYAYSPENFLGNGALTGWNDDGYDNLYRVASASFRYTSTETAFLDDKPTRTVVRTYNRFHLMTEEATTQGNCRKRVATSYYADDPDNINRPFEQQPPQCQLPMRIDTYWETLEPARSRKETSQTRFDEWGNPTEMIDADGTRETLEYYPAAGGADCPADPEGFVRHLRLRTAYPAASEHGSADTVRTTYGYVQLPPLPGQHGNYCVVEAWEKMQDADDTELQRVETEYFNDPADALRHARERKVSEKMNGLTTAVDHQYALLDSPRVAQSVLQVIETITGFDATQRMVTQEHSLLNGEPLLVEDENGVEIRYVYDALQRVVSETVAPGTEYAASRTYAYHLIGEDGTGSAWQEMTDVKEVTTRTWVDGVGRAVKEERQDADVEEAAGRNPAEAPLRPTYEASYDGLGQLIGEVEIDWFAKQDRRYPTGYAYDDWGERNRTLRPDGVTECEELDPVGRSEAPGPIRRTWLEDTGGVPGGVTETWLDLFGEPVRIERFDTGEASVSVVLQYQDGLGRVAEAIDARDRKTSYRYDAFSRKVETTLPGNAKVVLGYAPHSAEDLPVEITVNGTLLGTQTFDGLDRMVEAVTGGRARTMHYTKGDARPHQVDTPAGNKILYEYLPQLGEEVSLRTLPGVVADYSYDPKNSLLASCSEQGIGLSRKYYSTGQVREETRKANGVPDEVINYDYSLQGRMVSWRMPGVTQAMSYNAAGRVQDAGHGAALASFEYDTFGRMKLIKNWEAGSDHTLDVEITYDDFGREKDRTFTSAHGVRKLELTYYPDDALATRTLLENDVAVRSESFFYDSRSRLQRHKIEGTELPMDPFGKAYTQQVFVADALDNIARCITDYADGGRNTTTYDFDGTDPCQLQAVRHEVTRAGEAQADAAIQQTLAYDPDGNLIRDEEGRTLNYDPLGRLVGVEGSGTFAATQYGFDALDILTERTSGGVTERRYYVDGVLSARREGTHQSSWLRAGGYLLAEQMKGGTDEGVVLLATDLSNTVLGEVRPDAEQHVAYTAYGFPSRGPLWTTLGFNGEQHEPETKAQLLGSGYRALSPALMRFQGPDNLSPFDEGGLHAYGYCGNDPVNFVDPGGHFAWSVALPFFGMAALGAGGVVAAQFIEDPTTKSVVQMIGYAVIGVGVFGGLAGGLGASAGKSMNKTTPRPRGEKGKPQWTVEDANHQAPGISLSPAHPTFKSSAPPAQAAGSSAGKGAPNPGQDLARTPSARGGDHDAVMFRSMPKTRPKLEDSSLFSRRLQIAPLPPVPGAAPAPAPIPQQARNIRT